MRFLSESYTSKWTEICKAYCDKIGVKLIFVNTDNFGYETQDGKLVYMCADELKTALCDLKESSNPLKDVAEEHKKKQDGIGAFVKLDAGDVEKGNSMFNNATNVGDAPISGGIGEALDSQADNLYTLNILWANSDDEEYTEEGTMSCLGDLIERAYTFFVPELNGGDVSHIFISDKDGNIVWDSNIELSYYAYGLKDKFGNVIAMFGKDKETLNSKFDDFKKLVNLDSTDYELINIEEYNDLVQSFWNLEIDLASDNSSLHDNIILGNDGKTLKIRDLNYNDIEACLLSPIEIVDNEE